MEKSPYMRYNYGKPGMQSQVSRAMDPNYKLIGGKTAFMQGECTAKGGCSAYGGPLNASQQLVEGQGTDYNKPGKKNKPSKGNFSPNDKGFIRNISFQSKKKKAQKALFDKQYREGKLGPVKGRGGDPSEGTLMFTTTQL